MRGRGIFGIYGEKWVNEASMKSRGTLPSSLLFLLSIAFPKMPFMWLLDLKFKFWLPIASFVKGHFPSF